MYLIIFKFVYITLYKNNDISLLLLISTYNIHYNITISRNWCDEKNLAYVAELFWIIYFRTRYLLTSLINLYIF